MVQKKLTSLFTTVFFALTTPLAAEPFVVEPSGDWWLPWFEDSVGTWKSECCGMSASLGAWSAMV